VNFKVTDSMEPTTLLS